MARENRPASDTTAGPAVPGPRRNAGDQGDTGGSGTGQPGTRQPGTGQPEGSERPSPVRASADRVLEHTRLSGTWVAVGCFLVVLVILLIFIAQNGTSVSINFFGTHNDVYLGVAIVLAAVCGALLVMFAGMARIMQLRSRARRHRRAARKAAGG